ncbi:MAG TPA: hypothetical protein DSN98_09395, partial [Thermoplasmata archaeon]
MQKRIRKTVQKMVLLITVVGLFTGTFSTGVVSNLTKSTLPSALLNTNSEVRTNVKESEMGRSLAEGYTLQYTINFSKDDLSIDKFLGYDLVSMKDCSYLTDVGKPLLPAKRIMVALPTGMKVTNVQILSTREQPIPGIYTIFPRQKPLPVGETHDPILIVQPDKSIYLSPHPYPSSLISLGTQTDLAGQSMIELTINPLHYLPLQKKLTLTQSISFVIEGVEGYICGDYLPQRISENGRMIYEQMVKD